MEIKDFINGLQHVGIPTEKMLQSITFYQQLGFKLVNQEIQPDGGGVAFLENNDFIVELYEQKNLDGHTGVIDHIALQVSEEIDTLFEMIQAKDYPILSEGIETLAYWNKGISFFIIEGPNKEKIEFCEKH
ncbi:MULTISPECIES: VOC family protein [Enterococcaceae]|uniref:Glyoxalase/bleomycin resistance/dioxygenase family protein n=1 Tax=Vagococcus vulneris TaxID=1977869 RepID=A0A430A2C4_9ENTE|nr:MULTISPECIES: VOC family protein [Enterococcaceae]EJE4563051.1 VOC family protein [Enterococcus faecium]EJX51172.1 glyoxalase family protein [Enterococcus faecium R497]EKY7882996.1 VOC family protein [Enterococcus faecium]EKZ0059241.1 VOC family protein [Enterococcus faecium]EKZ0497283.1 VOC family protein [Enterococcus faecium]